MNNLIVISAPSGAGKSTLCRALQDKYPEILFSISSTTRPRRDYEKNGYDYNFITDVEFNQMIQADNFIEYEEVHGYYYGTPKANIDEAITNNKYLLLEVDVKGALRTKNAYPEMSGTVFITLPKVSDLLERLRKRGTESDARINRRMERITMELDHKNEFDHCIINDDLNRALNKLIRIIGIKN